MYHNSSPTGLYQEYQSRVAASVLKRQNARDAQTAQRPRQTLLARLGAWWSVEHERLVRYLQPAEPEGYIA